MCNSSISNEALKKALSGDLENPDQLLTIIANQDLNLARVAKFWCGYFGPDWEGTIQAKIDEGFVAFRIQTEFHMSGHSTMIYMAQMKVGDETPKSE